MDRILYILWTGTNEMSDERKKSVESIRNSSNVEVRLLYEDDILQIQTKQNEFHPAYKFLSETHKADYIRCYLMHNYGGGYADIKQIDFDWNPYFLQLEKSSAYGIGYQELKPEHIAIPPGHQQATLIRNSYSELIGNCNYIFKNNTDFTTEWFHETNKKLDEKYELLSKNPSSFPQDHLWARTPNGDISKYPLRWAEILGEIFHPLIFKYKNHILNNMPKYTKKQFYR